MYRIPGRALIVAAAVLALAAPATAAAASAGVPDASHVVLVGIGGLRWSDVSPAVTPALWRLAGEGSVGSLVVSGIHLRTCPADGWLTLNAAARAATVSQASGSCPALPAVLARPAGSPIGAPVPALVPAMSRLIAFNARFSYNPQWGLLAAAPGPGRCATAVGPGAAVALASRTGQTASYLLSPADLRPVTLARCPLTVIDLGGLPPVTDRPAGIAQGTALGTTARAAALHDDDRQLARIAASLPPGSILVVFAPGDGSQPHLRAIMVSGPLFRAGLLTSASTRQPGMIQLTDLTPTVLSWLGKPVPPVVVGSTLHSSGRPGPLPATLRMLTGQDLAAQVYGHTVTPFYRVVGFGYPTLFALIAVLPWGRRRRRRTRGRAVARAVGVWAASVPAGTFLASLVPWWTLPHPALVLYGLAAAWAAVAAAIALTGPWRRDPLGPPGVVAAITLGVIGLDLMTGSHLSLETPFGLYVLEAGRFYGLGNNAVGIYGASGILCATWLGGALIRRGRRGYALTAMAAGAAFTVVAAGWPGFGAKVGGTIAMVPAFLVLLAAAAKLRITMRRAVLVAASGLVLVTVFALVNYFVRVTGHSDVGGFIGQALNGGAGPILHRKISSNLRSLTANPFAPVIPLVVVALGLVVAWPARFRCTSLARAYRQIPLLRAALTSVWLMAVLGWFAEDSGVTVPAATLPLVLPLMVVILSSVAAGDAAPSEGADSSEGAGPTEGAPPPAGTGDRAVPGPGQPGYR